MSEHKEAENKKNDLPISSSTNLIANSLINTEGQKIRTITHWDPICLNNLESVVEDQFNFTIKNNLGIHARPASNIVQIVKRHSTNVIIFNNDKMANASSIVELMSLGVKQGTTITIKANGNHAKEVLRDLYSFMEKNL